MLSHVLRTISRHKLLGDDGPPAPRGVLCAVSGGPDSMALLACLWELAPRLRLRLEVATVDHGLRREATAELDLVARRAAALGLPWHPLAVDVAGARARRQPASGGGAADGSRGGRGIQEVARRLRLAALAELAEQRGLGCVALGHNADDQTETVLFRLLRGTGPRGLTGIPYRRGPFIRPLLDVTRAQIMAYLDRRSLPYAIDPSNNDLRYARARLRHRVLPVLRQENPRVDVALRALAAAVAAEFQTESPSAERSRDGVHVPTRLAAEIEAAARDGRGTRHFDLAGGGRATVAYGHVSVRRVGSSHDDDDDDDGVPTVPVTLPGPGNYPFGRGMRIEVRAAGAAAQADEDDRQCWSWFDGDLLTWPLSARPRRPGDRMTPRGGTGSRKLSDLLIDAKIPRVQRPLLPVITAADGELLFVPGLRPSRRGAPTSATLRRIGLAVLPKPDHDAVVDRSIARGNTGRYPYQNRHRPEPDEPARPDADEENRNRSPELQHSIEGRTIGSAKGSAVGSATALDGKSRIVRLTSSDDPADVRLDERKARAPGT